MKNEQRLQQATCLEGDCVEKEITRRKNLKAIKIRGIIIPPAPMLDNEVESKFDPYYDEKKK